MGSDTRFGVDGVINVMRLTGLRIILIILFAIILKLGCKINMHLQSPSKSEERKPFRNPQCGKSNSEKLDWYCKRN